MNEPWKPETRLTARSWQVSAEAWQEAWAQWPSDAIVLAEDADAVYLARRVDAGLPQRGHLFLQAWHVQWRTMGARVRVAGLGPVAVPEGWGPADAAVDVVLDDAHPRRLVLWGYRRSDEAFWMELRVPHVMTPPALHPAGHTAEPPAHNLRRRLDVYTYRDPADGSLFHRYTGLSYDATDGTGRTLELLGDERRVQPSRDCV